MQMESYAVNSRPTSPTQPPTLDRHVGKHPFKGNMWQKLHHLFAKDTTSRRSGSLDNIPWSLPAPFVPVKKRDGSSRPVGVGLPRQTTFKRQNSEKRDRLLPVQTEPYERRAFSTSRQNSTSLARFRSRSTPPSTRTARNSAPTVNLNNPPNDDDGQTTEAPVESSEQQHVDDVRDTTPDVEDLRPLRSPSITSSNGSYERQRNPVDDRTDLDIELDSKWILNLSMHFKDKSDREKFFVTYAEAPNKWRRVTVSCDYRNADPGSLEMDLKELTLQRDKSLQIYESIRDSLREIQFYDTVTNLKLQTSEGRLHVHVTEDVNEIIPYPPRSSITHILQDENYSPMEVCESALSFDSHLSGFVYRVRHQGRIYIKKEIPGPDTVDEFLYEINALHALHDSEHVIQLEGIVLDDTQQLVKGLLISYAERGAVVDLLYDHKGEIPWEDRERWARHAVKGLSEIHEEGYVQGDFTLSNIVVDDDNNAKIIDINRRGCPVGWEPPELAKKIASNQRISMYIGEKSDIYQLGMTLWALAMDDDEPERHDPPLSTQEFPSEVPLWYRDAVRICLARRPRDRMSAKDLLTTFPPQSEFSTWPARVATSLERVRTEKRYIDPEAAVERDDLERFRDEHSALDGIMYSPESSKEDPTFTYPRSSEYDQDHDYDSGSSDIDRRRGRRRISDHDLMLQMQNGRHDMSARNDDTAFSLEESPEIIDRAPEEPFCYEVDSNGRPRYLTESASESQARALRQSGFAQSEVAVAATSDDHTVSRASPDHLRALERRTRGRSDASEGTPRNSYVQLQSTLSTPYNLSRTSTSSETIPVELTYLGCHPNVSADSMEGYPPAVPDEIHATSTIQDSHLELPLTDSGYNEPLYFGVDPDDDECSTNVYALESRPDQPWSSQDQYRQHESSDAAHLDVPLSEHDDRDDSSKVARVLENKKEMSDGSQPISMPTVDTNGDCLHTRDVEKAIESFKL